MFGRHEWDFGWRQVAPLVVELRVRGRVWTIAYELAIAGDHVVLRGRGREGFWLEGAPLRSDEP